MAISGLQVINIGLQNESTGSDSLYTAFNKTKDNFATLFTNASPYNTFTGNGVTITANASSGAVNIDNTGVTNVALTSNTLSITGSPLTTTGTLTVNLPANVVVAGQLILNGSESLANAAAANLAVTASYFTTLTASTATLATGTAGQIKTFMMLSSGGNMVITVANPGWAGSGTITFSDNGDACTLQYIASKWFCVGNNGAVFA
jgi:hypothetical protein